MFEDPNHAQSQGMENEPDGPSIQSGATMPLPAEGEAEAQQDGSQQGADDSNRDRSGESDSCSVGDEVLDLIADVESGLSRLRAVTHSRADQAEQAGRVREQLRAERESLDAQAEELGYRDDRLAEQQRRIGEREVELDRWCAEVDAERQKLESEVAEFTQRKAEIEVMEHKLTEERTSLEAGQAQWQRDFADRRCDEIRHFEDLLFGSQVEIREHEQNLKCMTDLAEEAEGRAAELNERLHELESQSDDRVRDGQESAAQLEASREQMTHKDAQYEQAVLHGESLEADLASGREEMAKRDEAISELSDHIRGLQGDLQEARTQVSTACREAEESTRSHRQKTEQLETHAAELTADLQSASSLDGAQRPLLESRRSRLQRQKNLLRARGRKLVLAREKLARQVHEVAKLGPEKQILKETRETLVSAERRMIRRWARARAVTVAFMCLIIMLILAGASYLGVMEFWPTDFTATATVQAKGRPGFPLTTAQIDAWQTVHEQMLWGAPLLSSAASRLGQRGYSDLSAPEAIESFLRQHLSTHSPAPGTIVLELTASGNEDPQQILETYSIAFVSQSNAERHRRTDGATTQLVEAAQLDPNPVKDDRLQYAGIVFGGSVVFLLLAGGLFYARLRRTPGIFDGDDDLFTPMSEQVPMQSLGSASQQIAAGTIVLD